MSKSLAKDCYSSRCDLVKLFCVGGNFLFTAMAGTYRLPGCLLAWSRSTECSGKEEGMADNQQQQSDADRAAKNQSFKDKQKNIDNNRNDNNRPR